MIRGIILMDQSKYPEHLVFGLDIGTRSIVGTVGYKDKLNRFKVVAMVSIEHDTRAMLDGQIHDIGQVAETILRVKKQLESSLDRKLTEVCIAAAGRVLRTVNVRADYELSYETIVDEEAIHTLDLLAIEKAYELVGEDTKEGTTHFYCVGYSVINYYLNDYVIMNLEGHKANKISTELIATFLPEEVIDGLYRAVEIAGLTVVNLTLEPIAAINVAIPEKFRLLNLALVDVGAGTSDISITKDGSIIAYGMIPYAGDEITEHIAKKYLVDFATAETIKLSCIRKKSVSYKDILGIKHKLLTIEVLEEIDEVVRSITKNIADKIISLNGDKSVSAVFLVGGGGKIPNFTSALAEYLNIPKDRVAIRGAEVLQEVDFLQEGIKKDSLLVTPIGICMNYYEQKNNFVFVSVNGDRVKLYDNSKLTIVDAAIQFGFPNEDLFPKRGKPINYTLDGAKRMIRGEPGDAAIIKLNGKIVGMNTPIVQNDIIELVKSTAGADASREISQLPEYHNTIDFIFNEKKISCPKFVLVNNQFVSEYYNIQDMDQISILSYYSLKQVLEFMDLEYNDRILVNNVNVGLDAKIYENFRINCDFSIDKGESTTPDVKQAVELNERHIMVNGQPITLLNKKSYVFVDVFDFYYFDLKVAKGSKLVTLINGVVAEFIHPIHEGDIVEIFWEE